MRRAIKLIYRLDFPVNYEIINRPGDIIRILNECTPNYWSNVGEARDRRRVSGRETTPSSHYRELCVEPTNIFGIFEDVEGLDWEELFKSEFLENNNRLVSELIRGFGISDLHRCGIRFFCIESFGERYENAVEKFMAFLAQEKISELEDVIGKMDDASLLLHGKSDENLNFRLHFGPAGLEDFSSFLQNVSKPDFTEKSELPHHFIADMDFFERDFSFAGLDLRNWAATKWTLATQFMDFASAQMIKGQ